MKMPFRFFRGELIKGTYLKCLLIFLNYAVKDILDELVYHVRVMFKLDTEVDEGELPMRDEDIVNIGKIAGLFRSHIYGLTTAGSIFMTSSHIVNGQERSERGLVDTRLESVKFVREDANEYPDDIVTEASEDARMGFVPPGTVPVGYVPYGVDLYTNTGDVIWGNLLSVPPTDGSPYTEYYGEKFLVFEEWFEKEILLPVPIYKILLECVQRIRYNGPTVAGLLEITRILCENYIYDIEIVPADAFCSVFYNTDQDVDLPDRSSRYAAWKNVCEYKFKTFVFIDRGE